MAKFADQRHGDTFDKWVLEARIVLNGRRPEIPRHVFGDVSERIEREVHMHDLIDDLRDVSEIFPHPCRHYSNRTGARDNTLPNAARVSRHDGVATDIHCDLGE